MVEAILSAFPDARIHGGYAQIRCPYHADGQEQKPSMSVLLENRQTTRGTLEAGFCHCFACGKTTNIKQLFKDIGLEAPRDLENATCFTRKAISLTTDKPIYKITMPFRFSNYLKSRGIGEETQKKFKIYQKDDKVYMPVFNREGMYLYSNARSVSSKKFYIEGGAVKTLWGIEEIDLSRPIFVCESQIDALSLWEIGTQAVATLGADNISSLKLIQKATGIIVLAFDPDSAGIRARDRAADFLGKYRCKWVDLPEGVDINRALQDIQDKGKFKNFVCKCVKNFV